MVHTSASEAAHKLTVDDEASSRPTTSDLVSSSCGGINIRKLLNNLGKYDGSSYLNLLEEYIDNAFDAQANSVNIVFDSKRQKITIIDDGCGMNLQKMQSFCELWSDNCEEDENIDGKFGIGVKKANGVLSNKQSVTVSTNHNGKSIFAFIDYQKFLRENRYDNTSVPIKIAPTDEKNGTKITISTTSKIIDDFKNLYTSDKIADNLKFNLAFTYNYKILQGKSINLQFDDNQPESVPPIPYDKSSFITKTETILFYKKDSNKSFIYVRRGNSTTKEVCKHPFKKFEKENVVDYDRLKDGKFTLELRYPRETKNYVKRIKGPENVCTINDNICPTFYTEIKNTFDIKDSNTNIRDFFQNIQVKRNSRILANLNFDYRKCLKTSDVNQQNEYNSILKTIKYVKKADEYLPLAQETKSKVGWSNCPKGLKNLLEMVIKEFVDCDVKSFMKEPIPGCDYSKPDQEESYSSIDEETDTDEDIEDNNQEVNTPVTEEVSVKVDTEGGNNFEQVGNNEVTKVDSIDAPNEDVSNQEGNNEVTEEDSIDAPNEGISNQEDSKAVTEDVSVKVDTKGDNDCNVVVNLDCDADTASNQEEEQAQEEEQDPLSTYLYSITEMEDNRVIYKNEDGYVPKKFGITTQPIRDRLAGGNEYKKKYELDHKFLLSKEACNRECDIYNKSKHKVEVELFKALRNIDGVEFNANSTEKYKCRIDKLNEVEDIIIDICRKFRKQY